MRVAETSTGSCKGADRRPADDEFRVRLLKPVEIQQWPQIISGRLTPVRPSVHGYLHLALHPRPPPQ